MADQGSDKLMTPEAREKAERAYAEQVEAWRQEEARVAAQPTDDEPEDASS